MRDDELDRTLDGFARYDLTGKLGEDLRLAQRDDTFRDAVEILLTDAKLMEMKPTFIEKAKRWIDSRDNTETNQSKGCENHAFSHNTETSGH
jgi:hypothetical protein